MSPELNQPGSIMAETPEPQTVRTAIPVWMIILLFVLLYWGMVYFDLHGAWFNQEVYGPYRSIAELDNFQPRREGPDLVRGKIVYENVCALCHNPDGAGKPNQAPPFVGSEWALGSPNRMIRIPLVGLTGPVTVNGQQWNLSMPNMGAALSDDDLAATLSYIRSSWGNKAAPITADQVKAVRAQVGNRTPPFTADELMTVQ